MRKGKINIAIKHKLAVALAAITVTVGLSVPVISVNAAEPTIKVEKQLIKGIPKMYTTNEFVIAHESGNPSNTGINSIKNEVAYMTNNWQNAFVTHWVGSGGKVIQVAPTGNASWGAGGNVNYRTYAQVELARTNSKATFEKDYKSYVTLLRQLAKEAKIPVTLDGSGKGIKTHDWVTRNLGGTDHRDPLSYLESFGISKAQFAKDIANGIQSDNKPTTIPVSPAKPVKEYKLGDNVKVTGYLYRDSAGSGQSAAARGLTGKISIVNKGAKKPYHVGGLGWASSTDLQTVLVSKPSVPKPTVPKLAGSNLANSGYYTFTVDTNIRSGAGTNYASVGLYSKGETVYYDKKVTAGGYVWLHYISYTGLNRYVAVVQ